jgi:hypothetical protein
MSLLDTGNISEESQKAIVSFESKSMLSNVNRPTRTIADLLAFMEEMSKKPIKNKHYDNPNALKEDLEALEKMG